MMIYHVTQKRLLEPFRPEDGNKGEVYLFSDTLLPGAGPHVTLADVPPNAIGRYEVQRRLAPEGVRYFMIPSCEISTFSLFDYEFSNLTGRDWKDIDVELYNARDSKETGAWKRVWTSRFGVAIVHSRSEALVDRVTIRLTDLFDSDKDYVIVERQMYGGKKWDLSVMAGVTPQWADYPNQWQEWVMDPEVVESAVEYILASAPSAEPAIQIALRQVAKMDRIQAWEKVSRVASAEIGRELGQIPSGSMTGAIAMPVRIAQRIGPWEAPKSKPEYQKPDDSGRVLLAAPREKEEATMTTPIRRFDRPVIEGRSSYATADPHSTRNAPRAAAAS